MGKVSWWSLTLDIVGLDMGALTKGESVQMRRAQPRCCPLAAHWIMVNIKIAMQELVSNCEQEGYGLVTNSPICKISRVALSTERAVHVCGSKQGALLFEA